VVLQLLGILALLVSLVILFAAADRNSHNRAQMSLAGEVSQVLIELKQLANVQPANSAAYSDEIARLIGYGDVQTRELLAVSGNSLFASEGADLKTARTTLIESWKPVKKGLVTTYASSLEQTANTSASTTPALTISKQFTELSNSFDGVFAAIAQDTLSPGLLAANGQVLATLKNLDFVLSNKDNVNPAAFRQLLRSRVTAMQDEVNQLISLTRADNGSVLIGYESRQLLAGFAAQVVAFKVDPSSTQISTDSASKQSLQLDIANAINGAVTYQQLLEFASHQNRRAILFALAALCVALICLMLSLWRVWKSQINGNPHSSAELELLSSELCAIADGDLTLRASQQTNPTLSAIAQASNHTVDMLKGLVRVFQRAGNHLSLLAGSQQQLAKHWITSEIKRHEQLQQLSHNLQLQSQAVNLLSQIEARTTNRVNADLEERLTKSCSSSLEGSLESNDRVNQTRIAMQKMALTVSECQDKVGGGSGDSGERQSSRNYDDSSGDDLLRIRQRMHELTGSISAVRLAAEQARLQVLNTSLQMTACAGTADIDDQSRLVEEFQSVSNQLASSAAVAERTSTALAEDLQQYAETSASDKYDLIGHLDMLQQTLNHNLIEQPELVVTLSDPAPDEISRDEFSATLVSVQHQQEMLVQLVEKLSTDAVSDGDGIELLEHTNEILQVSASLVKSAELYTNNDE